MTVPRAKVRQRRWRRECQLQALGFPSYQSYLRSPEWAAKRHAYRESNRPQDCFCGSTEDLELHHLTYERVGCEELSDLTPLCARCHSLVHVLERRGEIDLDLRGLVDAKRAERYRTGVAVRPPVPKEVERRHAVVRTQLRRACDELSPRRWEVLVGRLRETLDASDQFV